MVPGLLLPHESDVKILIGKVLSTIVYFLCKSLITRLTWILTFDSPCSFNISLSLVVLSPLWMLVSLVLPALGRLHHGWWTSSAITKSPGNNLSRRPQCSVRYLSDVCPTSLERQMRWFLGEWYQLPPSCITFKVSSGACNVSVLLKLLICSSILNKISARGSPGSSNFCCFSKRSCSWSAACLSLSPHFHPLSPYWSLELFCLLCELLYHGLN